MAKPRVFVSSTYYDLCHIRDRLELFVENFGYDAVLFESGDIPFRHDKPLSPVMLKFDSATYSFCSLVADMEVQLVRNS
jgi:hypothetical protein